MTKSIAVAVIHGMGSQGKKEPVSTADVTFSKDLHKRLRKELGKPEFDAKVAWREIFWSDVLQTRQKKYLKNIRSRTDLKKIREFVMCNLSDAASYRKTSDAQDQTYGDIHARVAKTIKHLDQDVPDGTPLLVLAHSLGGHIMSNYIYDMQKLDPAAVSAFQKLQTMAGFVTFGCNIPIFTFAYDPANVAPIQYPGTGLAEEHVLAPWWYNFFDKDDVLGYPLAQTSPKYQKLATDKKLRDVSINAGGPFTSWNPASHTAYWKDDDLYKPVSRLMKLLW